MYIAPKAINRFFIVILIFAVTLCLSGCAVDSEKNSLIKHSSSSLTSDSVSNSSENSDIIYNSYKAGFLFGGDASNELSLTGQLNDQRLSASNHLGIDTCYVDNVDVDSLESAINQMKNSGCDTIISCVPNLDDALYEFATTYPQLNFINYGQFDATFNVSSYIGNINYGAYLSSVISAYNSETKKIGFIGDDNLLFNEKVADVIELGTQLVYKIDDIQIYTETGHTDREIKQGIDNLLANGCDIIVCYTETSYSEDYCQQKGVKFIGNLDFSGKEDIYSNLLMYFCCDYELYFYMQLNRLQKEETLLVNYLGSVSDGGITLSKALKGSKEGSQELIDAMMSKFMAREQIFDIEGNFILTLDRNLSLDSIVELLDAQKDEIREYIEMQYDVYDARENKNTYDKYSGDILRNVEERYGVTGLQISDMMRHEYGYDTIFVESVNISSIGDSFVVSGSVKNSTTSTVKFVVVKIVLQDKDGRGFDSDTVYAVGEEGLRPGDSAKFKCYFDSDSRLENYSASILRYDN